MDHLLVLVGDLRREFRFELIKHAQITTANPLKPAPEQAVANEWSLSGCHSNVPFRSVI